MKNTRLAEKPFRYFAATLLLVYAGASFAADEPAKSSLVAKPAEAAPKPSELTQWLDGWSTTHVPEATPGTLGYALLHGTPWVVLRYRYETVEQNGLKDGVASTLRTRFGYETGAYHNFKLGVEGEDISKIGETAYNKGYNGNTAYASIKDAPDRDLNQLYLSYEPIAKTKATVGRQVIVYDNQRWVGESDWRQNNQTFDALTISSKTIPHADLNYAFISNVNRTSGPSAPDGEYRSHSHLLNLSYQFAPELKATGYGYFLEFDNAKSLSSNTVGLRLKGDYQAFEDFKLSYTLEGANQQDGDRNPNSLDENYYLIEPAVSAYGLTAKLGYEVLEGNGKTSLQTPLASYHSPNGWANKFTTNPVNGLEDRYASLNYKVPFGNEWVKGTSATVAYHIFDANHIDSTYGRELDFTATQTFADHYTLGLEYDKYMADRLFTDTQKFDVWLGVKF